MALTEAALRGAADKLIQHHRRASDIGEWTFFVDEMYAMDCVYTCEYAGTFFVEANGIDEIKATHYGRDMQVGWEGWTFPYDGVYVGTENRVVTHWWNRGPGVRPDGSFYQTPGVSFLTFDDNSQIIRQFDVFDLAHQMNLCDELDAQGLLSPALRDQWVTPTKARLIEQLTRQENHPA
ncbi:MAG: nuclear transport factor 2 family protein [Pseudomonadota bacterium]